LNGSSSRYGTVCIRRAAAVRTLKRPGDWALGDSNRHTMDAILNLAGYIASHPLTRDRKLQAFRRLLRWQIESRLRREVVVPWVEGPRLAARRGMAGATGNIYCGLHEFEDMAFVLHFLRPGDLFADVGANIGSYTVLAYAVRKARSFVFEPDPITFAASSRNIALNQLDNLVRRRGCALGSRQGSVEFTVGLDTVNHVAGVTDRATRTVALDTLDRACGNERPSLIKLDVEGLKARFSVVRPKLCDDRNSTPLSQRTGRRAWSMFSMTWALPSKVMIRLHGSCGPSRAAPGAITRSLCGTRLSCNTEC
jgi:FkbM family methyltransferase